MKRNSMQAFAPHFLLLQDGEGTIEAHEEQQSRLDELTYRIENAEFYVPTTESIPCKCIDGRSCDYATEGPNAAGGTESLFVADDLTTKRFAAADNSVTGGIANIVSVLCAAGIPVGGHSDTAHSDPLASGCGANDKLAIIYQMIMRKPDVIRQYAEAILGDNTIDDDTHSVIIQNARLRTDFAHGHDVLAILEHAENARVEQLEGAHSEVVAAINLRINTTLDRKLLSAEFGAAYQAFNVDAWSFGNASKLLSETDEDADRKMIAMTYYNLATALVLCGPHMRVVIVK